jgi:DNA mismatch repair ATPase MutS
MLHIFKYILFTNIIQLSCFNNANLFSHHFEALQERTESGRDRLVYTHKLLPGVTQVENYGLHLAQVLACPELILNNSKKLAQKLSSQRKVKIYEFCKRIQLSHWLLHSEF